MKKLYLCLVTATIYLVSNAFAEPFRVPAVPNGETHKFKVTRQSASGKEPGIFIRPSELVTSYSLKTTWKTDGNSRLMLVERRDKKAAGHGRTWTFTFRAANTLKFERYEMVETRPDGEVLGREEGQPWFPKMDTLYNIVHPLAVSEAIRGFPFKEKRQWDYMSWMPQTEELNHVFVKVETMEKVDVPAGSFNSWRVTLDLDMDDLLGRWRGMEFLIKPLIPKFTMWFADMPQSPMVQFRGKFGTGKNTIIEEHKLVEMTP